MFPYQSLICPGGHKLASHSRYISYPSKQAPSLTGLSIKVKCLSYFQLLLLFYCPTYFCLMFKSKLFFFFIFPNAHGNFRFMSFLLKMVHCRWAFASLGSLLGQILKHTVCFKLWHILNQSSQTYRAQKWLVDRLPYYNVFLKYEVSSWTQRVAENTLL